METIMFHNEGPVTRLRTKLTTDEHGIIHGVITTEYMYRTHQCPNCDESINLRRKNNGKYYVNRCGWYEEIHSTNVCKGLRMICPYCGEKLKIERSNYGIPWTLMVR